MDGNVKLPLGVLILAQKSMSLSFEPYNQNNFSDLSPEIYNPVYSSCQTMIDNAPLIDDGYATQNSARTGA